MKLNIRWIAIGWLITLTLLCGHLGNELNQTKEELRIAKENFAVSQWAPHKHRRNGLIRKEKYRK